MARLPSALRALAILVVLQALGGCAWSDHAPLVMKVPSPVSQATPCIAAGLGKEFQDAMPVVDRGEVLGGTQISVNAPRGGLLAFVTIEPLPDGGSAVTFYNGDLYWPKTQTDGVFPDVARDNWHRAEAAIRSCQPAA
ncbi:MAG TPA: hypothetical protein VMT54_02065 [Candidatus Cybelea sp.]|nr:hypothetical protein [Candidatus Cybelea sp.]